MPFYLRILICLIPLAFTLVLICLVYKKGKKTNEKTVLHFPLLFRIVPILMFGVTAIGCVCILLFQFEEWPLAILIFVGFSLPGLIMFIMWSLWRVDVKEDGFVYRNFLGRKKEYKYEDLEYQMHPKGMKWYFYKDNKKVICIANWIENEDFLEKRYRKYIRQNKE